MSNGVLHWIGIAPEKKAPVVPVDSAELVAGSGIRGDRRASLASGDRQSRRHVTLIRYEDLQSIAAARRLDTVDPALLRRNMVVRGLDFGVFETRRFRIGPVVLEHTGECTPCKRMDIALGPGGQQAMEGLGGITAVVIVGGMVKIGDPIDLVAEEQAF